MNPIKSRKNLSIITHAHSQNLIFCQEEPDRVVGVAYLRKGTPQVARVKPGGEVVLSAGAIGSPQLLELSGIGRGTS